MKTVIAAFALLSSMTATADPICNQVSDVVLRASIDRDNGFTQEQVRQSMMLKVDASLWTTYSNFINTVYTNPAIKPTEFAMGAQAWCEDQLRKAAGKRT